jgi:hypothetical protein
MPRSSWAYIDWVKLKLNGDMTEFFKECEAILMSEEERHDVYQNTVYKNYLECEMAGLPRPEWCTPATQEDIELFEERFSTIIKPNKVTFL